MTAGYNVDGIKLQTTQLPNHVHDALGVGVTSRTIQILSRNGEPTGQGPRNDRRLFHYHRLIADIHIEKTTWYLSHHQTLIVKHRRSPYPGAMIPHSHNILRQE